jgi:formylglycine-generating enzyme required for sulfatase activity
MGNNPSMFEGDDRPIENVSWEDVQEFIKKLNEMENTDKYRLPSEAEWEYACRAGTQTRYSFGDDKSKLKEHSWYAENSDDKTHFIGQKKPNSWELYDMHGNVWEWVQDGWHENYKSAPSDGSTWEDGSPIHVIRGGGCFSHAYGCQSVSRYGDYFRSRSNYVGFRLLREI